jgi:hypothetical protein
MYQAIETRFVGATGNIIAKAQAGRVTVPYNHEIDTYDNHVAAAEKLCARFDWVWDTNGTYWRAGANSRGDGYVFVRID